MLPVMLARSAVVAIASLEVSMAEGTNLDRPSAGSERCLLMNRANSRESMPREKKEVKDWGEKMMKGRL
jgi:hypothetical protein